MANEEKDSVRKLSIVLSGSMGRCCRTCLVLPFLIGGIVGILGTVFAVVGLPILKPVWWVLLSLTTNNQYFVLVAIALALIFVALILWLVLHYAWRVYLEVNASYDSIQGWSRSIIEKGIECLCTLERSKDVKSSGVTVVINHDRKPIPGHEKTSITSFTYTNSLALSSSTN